MINLIPNQLRLETNFVGCKKISKNYFEIFGLHTLGIEPDDTWLFGNSKMAYPPQIDFGLTGSRHDRTVKFYFWVIVIHVVTKFWYFPLAVQKSKYTAPAKKPLFRANFDNLNSANMCLMTEFKEIFLSSCLYEIKFASFIFMINP